MKIEIEVSEKQYNKVMELEQKFADNVGIPCNDFEFVIFSALSDRIKFMENKFIDANSLLDDDYMDDDTFSIGCDEVYLKLDYNDEPMSECPIGVHPDSYDNPRQAAYIFKVAEEVSRNICLGDVLDVRRMADGCLRVKYSLIEGDELSDANGHYTYSFYGLNENGYPVFWKAQAPAQTLVNAPNP